MLIDKIELYLVRNTFSEPWHTAYGTDEENCVLITRMISGNHEGWSESSPLPGPHYSYEYGEGIYRLASHFLAPHIVGKDMTSSADVYAAMSAVKGNPFAKAGIEMAWWTLQADIKGVPLRRLLGQAGDPIVELASIPNMVYPHDITPETEGYLEPICEVPLENCAPYQFQTTSNVGTPIKPDMAKMLAKTEKHCIIEAK